MSDFVSSLARTSSKANKKSGPDGAAENSGAGTEAHQKSEITAKDNAAAELVLSKAQLAALFKFLLNSGLFDAGYYTTTYPEIAEAGVDPLEHFYFRGYLEGRRPNLIFDPTWYLSTYPDVRSEGKQPLLHYTFLGELEGRQPSPLFNPRWYRQTYSIPDSQNALAHYLKNRFGRFSPIPEFDAKYYLETYADIADAKVDPFEHYIFHGYREG